MNIHVTLGIGKLERQQCPLPHHIRRLAAQLSLSECREVTVRLGSKEWNDLQYQFQHQPPNDLKFTALWDCTINNSKFSFDSLHIVLENTGLSGHELCQVNTEKNIEIKTLRPFRQQNKLLVIVQPVHLRRVTENRFIDSC